MMHSLIHKLRTRITPTFEKAVEISTFSAAPFKKKERLDFRSKSYLPRADKHIEDVIGHFLP